MIKLTAILVPVILALVGPPSYTAFLGVENGRLEQAVTEGLLKGMTRELQTLGYRVTLGKANFTESAVQFYYPGLRKPEAEHICQWVTESFGYYKCEVQGP